MAINKVQRSRLTFDLSAKSLIFESHQYIKHSFHTNHWPNFTQISYAKLAKFVQNILVT